MDEFYLVDWFVIGMAICAALVVLGTLALAACWKLLGVKRWR